MEDSFKNLVDSTNSVLILLPEKPYFDQVSAGLSLYLSLLGKKDVKIACPASMLVEYSRLVGVNKITSELGNKNLMISLGNYPASNIEKVSYDIENQEFKLTVIPKNNMTPPTKDQVKISFTGVSADLVLLIGGATTQQFPALSSEELSGVKLAHIGVKSLVATGDEKIMSFAQTSSSVSEIVFGLIKQIGYELDQDIATNLLLGIEEASKNYTSDYVTADTFQVVADLMRAGGRRSRTPIKNIPDGAQPAEIFNQPKKPQFENEDKTKDDDRAPKEWLSPKIYKGTSTS